MRNVRGLEDAGKSGALPNLLSTSSLTLAVVSASATGALAGGKSDKLVVETVPQKRGFSEILQQLSNAFQRIGEDEDSTYYLGEARSAPVGKQAANQNTPARTATQAEVAKLLQPGIKQPVAKADETAPVYASPVVITPVSADAGSALDAVKWHPHVDLIAKPGTDRMIGKADFFAPITQDQDSMFFVNMRGVFTSDPIQEGNFGLGYRQIVRNGFFGQDAIYGVYGFFDVRNSQNNNTFYQGTLGAEILTEIFEFRANAYLPNRKTHQVSGGGGGGGAVVLNGVALQAGGGGLIERALPGFDLEAGVKIPLFDKTSFRFNAAYFRFERGQTLVEGPRLRAEVIWDDLGGWTGAKLSLGGEVRDDRVRGTDGYGFVRLRIPLYGLSQPSGDYRPKELTGIDREMTRFIHRDADIITPTVEDPNGGGGNAGQPLTDAASNEELHVFEVASAAQGAGDCTSGNACTVAEAFGAGGTQAITPGIGDIIFVVNDGGGSIASNITLDAVRQQVVGDPTGAGTQVTLPDAANSVFTATNGSGRATLDGFLQLSQDNTVRGFDINSTGGVAVQTPGANIGTSTFSDMTIQGSTGGVQFAAASSGTANFANNVTINNAGTGAAFNVLGGTASSTFSGNLNNTAANQAAVQVQGGHTGTLTFDTGTIMDTAGTGLQFDNADGTYNFNGTATLNGGDAGIDILNGSNGTFTFGAGTAITNANANPAFRIDNGDEALAGLTYSGNITNTNGRAVQLSNITDGAGNITFQTGTIADSGTGTGIEIGDVDEQVNFNGPITLQGADGLDIRNGSAGTFTFANTTITDVGNTAFLVDGADNSTVNFNGGAITQNTANRAVEVTGTDNATIDINVLVTANTSTSTAISLSNNTGSNINFDGGLNIDTTTGQGFDASGGGNIRVSATAGDESVNSTNDRAIDISGVTTDITFDSVTSNNSGNEGIDLTNLGAGSTFEVTGTTTISNATDAGIEINSSQGTFTFASVDIDGTGQAGIQLTNTTGTVNINGGNIDNTGGTNDGINATNTTLNVSGVTFGAATTGAADDIGGDGIEIQNTDAVNRMHTIAGVTMGATAGDTADIAGRGVFINSSGTGVATVNFTTASTIRSTDHAISTTSTNLNTLVLALDNITAETGGGEFTLDIQGTNISADTSSTVVTSLNSLTIEANNIGGGGGGAFFNNVSFDADGVSGGAVTQVTATGTTQIGQGTAAADRIQGDGLSFINPTGNLNFTTLNIFNNLGTGLEVNTKGANTNFNLEGGGSGTIDTTNGAAMFLDPLTGNLVFGSVTSADATVIGGGGGTAAQASGNGIGIFIDALSATGGAGNNALTIGTLEVTGAAGDGLQIINSDNGTMTFGSTGGSTFTDNAGDAIQIGQAGDTQTVVTNFQNTTTIDIGASANTAGVNIEGNNGQVTFSVTNISDVKNDQTGVDFTGSQTSAAFGVTTITSAAGSTGTGIDLSSTAGGAATVITFETTSAINFANAGAGSVGVQLAADDTNATSANANFTFGDGALAAASTINVNAAGRTVDTIGLNAATGTYNFIDVIFTGTADLIASSDLFVYNGASVGGDGSLNNPFSVAEADALAGTENFFFKDGVYDFGGTTFTLAAGQTMEGFDNGNTASFGGAPANVSGLGAAGGTISRGDAGSGSDGGNGGAVSISATGANIVSLAGGNMISDLTFDGTGANDVIVGNGNATANTLEDLTISNVTAGNAAVEYTGSTVVAASLTATNVAISNVAATGFGVFLDNNAGTIDLNNVDVIGSAGTSLSIDSGSASTGAIDIDVNSNIAGTTGTVVSIGAGTRNVTVAGAINAANNTEKVIDIDGQSGGAIAFNGAITSDAATGDNVIEVTGQSGGTLTFGTVGITNYGNAAADVAIEVAGTGGSVSFGDTDIAATTGGGFSATGAGYSVSTAAGGTISANQATALNLNGVTIGTGGVNFDTVTGTNLGSNSGIEVQSVVTSGGQGINIGSTTLSGLNAAIGINVLGITGAGGLSVISGDIDFTAGVGTGVAIQGANTGATVSIGTGTSNSVTGLNIDGGGGGVLISQTAGTVNLGTSATGRVRIGASVIPGVNGISFAAGTDGTINVGNSTTQSSVSSNGNSFNFNGIGATADINVTNVTVSSAGGSGVLEGTSAAGATIDFNSLQVTGTGGGSNAIVSTNTDGALTFTALDINTAGGVGVSASDNNTTGSLTINGTSTIDGAAGDAVNISGLDTTIAGSLTIGGTTPPGADGIDISDGGQNIDVTVDGVTVTTNAFGSAGMRISGSGAGVLTINSFSANTVVDAAAGGILIDNATFDATTGGAIDQVLAGATSVGTIGNRVEGDGVRLNLVLGNVNFSDLDVFNNNGTGLFVRDAGAKAGTFGISTTTGTINTTNGTALDIDPVQGNFTFATIDSTNANGQGSSLNTAGGIFFDTVDAVGGAGNNALTVTGATNISNSTNDGINILNSSGTFTFGGQVTIDNDGGTNGGGVDIDLGAGDTATVNFNGGLNIDTTTGTGFDANGTAGTSLTLNVANAGTETIDTTSGSSVIFNDVTIGGSGVSFDSLNVTALGANFGMDLQNVTGGNFATSGGTITYANNGAGIGVRIGSTLSNQSGGNGTVNIGTGINSTNGLGVAIDVAELNGAAVTFSGNLTDNNAAGGGILVRNINNGAASSVTFSGTTKQVNTGANAAVSLTSNPDGTINFTGGGLDIDTTTGTGFNATGGGTVTVQGTGNSILTTTGTAFNLNGITIGAGGVDFDTVGVDGAANGITLTNVSGTGTVDLGVTNLQNVTTRGIDIAGTQAAPLTFSNLDISLNAANAVALDLNGAVITGAITAGDFDVTSTSAVGTVGIDLTGATGAGIIQLGDQTTGDGNGASIAGVNEGVLFSNATNLTDFNYGDREGTTDTASTINATTSIAGTLPANGDYDFLDVDVSVGSFAAISGPDFFVFDELASAGAGTFADPGTATQADASSATVLIAVNDTSGGNNLNLSTTGDGTLNLASGQVLISLGSGDSFDVANLGVTGGSLPGGFSFTGLAGGTTITADNGGGNLSATRPTITNGGAGNTIQLASTGNSGVGNSLLTNGGTGAEVVELLATGTNSPTVHLVDNQITSGRRGFELDASNSSTTTATITGNTFMTNSQHAIDVEAASGFSGTVNFTITGNTIEPSSSGSAVRVDLNSGSTAGTRITGTIGGAGALQNTIGNSGTAGSGGFDGISVESNGNGTIDIDIINNTIDQWTNGNGIGLVTRGNSRIDATVTDNVLRKGGGMPNAAIALDLTGNGGDTTQLCVVLTGNDVVGQGAGFGDIIYGGFVASGGSQLILPTYGGGPTDTAAIESFISGNNVGTPSYFGFFAAGSTATGTGTSCP